MTSGTKTPEEEKKQGEMSNYINIDNYNRYEGGHPGYHEMMNAVVNKTISNFGGKIGKILEIGSGTGNYTRRIGETHTAHIDAIEIDPTCNKYLEHKKDIGEIQHTKLMNEDFMKWADGKKDEYNAVNTTFADHHFSPDQKPEFLKRIAGILKPGGEYVLGDEFLPPHDETSPAERVRAQIQYHGMVIEEAFKEGKVELPNLELDALISGLHTTMRFIRQTVPDYKEPEGAGNGNAAGVAELKELIGRMRKIADTPLENPEQLSGDIKEKRFAHIARLEKLADEMQASRQPGLEEHPEKGIVGGDYKMTIRQYGDYLDKAGLKGVGYFEGPVAVGDVKDALDKGTGMEAITLDRKNHAGGVWVIRAMKKDDGMGQGRS